MINISEVKGWEGWVLEKYVCVHALRWKLDAGGPHVDDGKKKKKKIVVYRKSFAGGEVKLPC